MIQYPVSDKPRGAVVSLPSYDGAAWASNTGNIRNIKERADILRTAKDLIQSKESRPEFQLCLQLIRLEPMSSPLTRR